MANSASAGKRAHQAERRRRHNGARRSLLRTHIKKVIHAIEANDKAAAENAYKVATPIIDRMANKGIVHKNKAARQKKRLNTLIKAM